MMRQTFSRYPWKRTYVAIYEGRKKKHSFYWRCL